MRSYSVHKLVPLTVLSFRIVTKCRVTVYVLNIFVGSLSPAFRKIIRLKKTLYECFSWVQDPRGIIIVDVSRSIPEPLTMQSSPLSSLIISVAVQWVVNIMGALHHGKCSG